MSTNGGGNAAVGALERPLIRHPRHNYHRDPIDGSALFVYGLYLLVASLLTFALAFEASSAGAVLIVMLPAIFLVRAIRTRQLVRTLKAGIMAEQFLLGASLSIATAVLLEASFMSQFKLVNDPYFVKKPTVFKDMLFTLGIILSVGVVEEFSKILPCVRLIAPDDKQMRTIYAQNNYFWYRYIITPSEFVLAACASAAGFATLESIKYSLRTGTDSPPNIQIALMRSVIAVPFHIFLTGIFACLLASRMWSTDLDGKLRNKSTSKRGTMACCVLSAFLHGIYDSSLFLTRMPPVKLNSLVSQRSIQNWQLGCALTAVSTAVLSMFIFLRLWNKLLVFELRHYCDLKEIEAHMELVGPGYSKNYILARGVEDV